MNITSMKRRALVAVGVLILSAVPTHAIYTDEAAWGMEYDWRLAADAAENSSDMETDAEAALELQSEEQAEETVEKHFSWAAEYTPEQLELLALPYEELKKIWLEHHPGEAYEEIATVETPQSIFALVNKNNQLPADYIPENMTYVDGRQIDADVAEAFEAMRQAMETEIGECVYIVSGYRSFDTQRATFAHWLSQDGLFAALHWSAKAGHSEHQTGLAFDIFQRPGSVSSFVGMRFEYTAQYSWLQEHAHEYGFIHRYQQGEDDVTGFWYEPWHYRYVGTDIATDMKERGILSYEIWYWINVEMQA